MLTISKPLSVGQVQTYHQKELTAKEQNYYSQQGVIAGERQERLAGQFRLAGAVPAENFARLSQGQHPQTGEQLVRQRASYEYQDADGKTIKTMEHRAGWDATLSAPKSVSLTALVGGDQRVREAHRESVRVALDQLEHYTQARIGGDHLPETTGRFIAAKFEHDTARPVDGYAAPPTAHPCWLFSTSLSVTMPASRDSAAEPPRIAAVRHGHLSIRVDLPSARRDFRACI
jgi:conjugative relaxase-like TrwC/TraI family protein